MIMFICLVCMSYRISSYCVKSNHNLLKYQDLFLLSLTYHRLKSYDYLPPTKSYNIVTMQLVLEIVSLLKVKDRYKMFDISIIILGCFLFNLI